MADCLLQARHNDAARSGATGGGRDVAKPAVPYVPPQSVQDALADAETLRLNVVIPRCPTTEEEAFRVYANVTGAGRCGDGVRWGLAKADQPEQWIHTDAYMAARAAFRACPALKGAE